MNGRNLSENNSSRSYRWVRIWLGAGVLTALILLGNSVRDYFFVARILAIQQVRHQVTQHIAAFEHDLRVDWTPGRSRMSLLLDDMSAGSYKPLWVVLRTAEGKVLEQSGTPERALFSPDQESSHFRTREPLFDVIPSSQGEAVVEVFPVYAGNQRPEERDAGARGGPFVIAVEVAMPLSAADTASLWPIRRNLMINIASGFALLLTVGLTGWGFRSYVRGKRLEQQLEIAREVQENLLPKTTQLGGGLQIAVHYQPAEDVAGDFYDTFQTRQGLALVIGDVSGKGIPAALLMGVIHGAVRSSSWTDSRDSHQRETRALNQLLCERASGEQFATMFWGCCDFEKHTVHYINAGHCAPILIGLRNGALEMKRLDEGGPVLGLLPSASYTQGCVGFQSGDALVLYSDGLVEAMNATGEEFGDLRLLEVLSHSVGDAPEKIRDGILANVNAFLNGLAAHDDQTFVVATFGCVQA